MKISEVNPIEESGYVKMPTRDELASLVELPILNACQILWDKNIITGMSSANKKDVGLCAYIQLPKKYLSEENLAVLETIPNVSEYLNGMTEETAKISYPVNDESTVEEVSSYFDKIAGMFSSQDILYGVYPLTSARECYREYTGIDDLGNESDEKIAESLGMIVHDGLIFDSSLVFERHLNYLNQQTNISGAKY